MPTKLTFYGGVNEIGGNKILLQTAKAKIFLDFGMSFKQRGMFYNEFLNPRKVCGMTDYVEMGLVPWMKGLYREDYVKRASMPLQGAPSVDAMFLSHPHTDHSAFLTLLKKDIPCYMGETTKSILKAMEDTSSFSDLLTFREQFTGIHHTKNPKVDRPINTFRTGNKIQIKDITVTPVHVDHSIPGSYGFVIETPDSTLAYSGDFRMHGNNAWLTKDFVKEAASIDPDVFLVEGTHLGNDSLTEEGVCKNISEHIAMTKGMVIANFPPRDVDRINTFYKAAKENDRKLVIDFKMAYLLKMLENDDNLDCPKINDKNILIYCRKKKEGVYQEKDYGIWEREFLNLPNTITTDELDQKNSVFYCSNFMLGELIDLKPKKGSVYIHSLTEPFNDEMEIDHKRLENWLTHFNLPFIQAHASGHASLPDMREVLEEMQPKQTIPIHTEKAEAFRQFKPQVRLVQKNETVSVGVK